MSAKQKSELALSDASLARSTAAIPAERTINQVHAAAAGAEPATTDCSSARLQGLSQDAHARHNPPRHAVPHLTMPAQAA